MTADDSFETKARQLRAFHRASTRRGEPWITTKAHFAKLFGRQPERGEAEQLCTRAWIEARELAGWTYRFQEQAWYRADGSKVINDDGSEWRHI